MFCLDYSKRYFHLNSLRNTIIFWLPNLSACSTKPQYNHPSSPAPIVPHSAPRYSAPDFGPIAPPSLLLNLCILLLFLLLSNAVYTNIQNFVC